MNYLLPITICIPLLTSFLIFFFGKKIGEKSDYLSIFSTGITLIVNLVIFYGIYKSQNLELTLPWFQTSTFEININLFAESISGLMILIVGSVSLLTQIYSIGYLSGHKKYTKYFSYMSFFTACMYGLILAQDLILFFIFWEFVGLSSYLLIGFYFQQKKAALAQKKAFLFTKFGDLGLLIGIFLMFQYGISVEALGETPKTLLTLISLLFLSGAIGKSAQFPLIMWLPRAMAGPTPVSALLHAATMVAAGVFLLIKFFPLFTETSLLVVLIIGSFTALLGALIATSQNNIKKIVAFSTISQLGFMFAAVGASNHIAAMFHLETHAFFKALLFLCAGSITYAFGTQNINKIKFSWNNLPITYFSLLIGCFALSGIPPFNGFFSKEQILTSVYHQNKIAFIILLISTFFTAFYIFRLFFKITSHTEIKQEIKKPPFSMKIAIIALAYLTILTGILKPKFFENQSHDFLLPTLTTLISISGIFLAYQIFEKKNIKHFITPFLKKIFNKHFYLDHLHIHGIVKPTHYISKFIHYIDQNLIDSSVNGISILTLSAGKYSKKSDKKIIDRIVNKVGELLKIFGQNLRKIQTGNVQTYIFIFLTAISILFLYIQLK